MKNSKAFEKESTNINECFPGLRISLCNKDCPNRDCQKGDVDRNRAQYAVCRAFEEYRNEPDQAKADRKLWDILVFSKWFIKNTILKKTGFMDGDDLDALTTDIMITLYGRLRKKSENDVCKYFRYVAAVVKFHLIDEHTEHKRSRDAEDEYFSREYPCY